MVAYSFQKRFIEPIRSGRKRQTIRADRKRHARAGEVLQLYSGMRTSHCLKIGEAVCDRVRPIRIDFEEERIIIGDVLEAETRDALDSFASTDGFASWGDLVEFWKREHDDGQGLFAWSGVIISWKDFR
jgi:uncharacterized protein YqfB (UPF0267 family)